MKDGKPELKDIKAVIDIYAAVCYKMGKVEARLGIGELEIDFPIDVLGEMINDMNDKKEEKPLDSKETMENIVKKADEIEKQQEPEAIKITKETEERLIKKFGKKPMEKLAKQIGFNGIILNKIKEKQHAN